MRRTLELESGRMLAWNVRELVLRSADRAPIDYLAGQWFKLYLGDGLDRDYSVASAPDAERPDRFAIAVTRVEGGLGSERLHQLEVGARVDALGPSGFFVREDEHRGLPALMIGTGTGLAPLRAILQEEIARGERGLTLLFGCRTEEDILWRDDLERWARRGQLALEVTLSRAGEGWDGRRGWVQHHLPSIARSLGPAHYYVCGLSRMVTEVRRVLKEELGVDRRFVHTERYD